MADPTAAVVAAALAWCDGIRDDPRLWGDAQDFALIAAVDAYRGAQEPPGDSVVPDTRTDPPTPASGDEGPLGDGVFPDGWVRTLLLATPVDPDDGTVVIGYGAEGPPIWGRPGQVAVDQLAVLANAGLLPAAGSGGSGVLSAEALAAHLCRLDECSSNPPCPDHLSTAGAALKWIGNQRPAGYTVDGLLTEGRAIWGDRDPWIHLGHVVSCAAVVVGDLARQAREQAAGRPVDEQVLRRELGNLVVSGIRWADDLGLDVARCIEAALEAQLAFVAAQRIPDEVPTEPVVMTREDLTAHIDDPVCTCARCRPEWHTGIRCNCGLCRSIRETAAGVRLQGEDHG